ncbi:MAG: putative peptidoglycan glycosyltransferase FtsW [Candidatus Pacebacteria bacterium]|nr:putative peptidoglycan glycosyltransferase FtsW [Candidatus Paceibacterota bacterium]
MIFKNYHIDYWLLTAVIMLVFIGILTLSGISTSFAQERFGNSYYYLYHQLVQGILFGFSAAFLFFVIPVSFLKKTAWLLFLVNIVFMVLVFVPGLGINSGGASRWFDFGFFSFQPSEFLKLTFILYLSVWLSKRYNNFSYKKEGLSKMLLAPFLVILFVIFITLYFQSNASNCLLFFLIALLMYFTSETPLSHILIVTALFLIVFSIFILSSSYRMNRILVLFGQIEDPQNLSYQIGQSIITIGSGGIFGQGIGMSDRKTGGLLPQPMSDSIFAIFAEEAGFVGSFILISLFLFIIFRCCIIAKKTNDKFSKIFAVGIGSWISIQAFINIGAVSGIFPLTGIPLPFLSYGGSHIIAELAGIGLLLNISKSLKK